MLPLVFVQARYCTYYELKHCNEEGIPIFPFKMYKGASLGGNWFLRP